MSDVVVAGAVAGAIAGVIIGASVIVAAIIVSRRVAPGRPAGVWRAATSQVREAPAQQQLFTRTPASQPTSPFEMFNDGAKRVLALAQNEAIRFNHNYMGTEHLLLGLVREGEGVAARVLDSFGIQLSKVRAAVEHIIGRGDSVTSPSEITLSPRTKKVIELAAAEKDKLGHSHVGTEHLLLGLVTEGEGIASGILQSLGVTSEQVRHRVIAHLGQQHAASPSATSTSQGGPFDRFDSASKRILALAQDEAVRMGHNWIGTEHLMLGFVRDAGRARDALVSLGLELDAARAAVEAIVPRRGDVTPSEITLTPRMHQLFGKAIGMSRANHRSEITPVLLLLALVDDTDAVGTQVLTQLGATPDKVRGALAEPPPGPSASA